MIDPDSVPSSIEAAARQLSASMSKDNDDHFGTSLTIRNQWSLWEADSPLQRDAAARYGIAHADDISGLSVAWANLIGLLLRLWFDPLELKDRALAFGTATRAFQCLPSIGVLARFREHNLAGRFLAFAVNTLQ